MSFKVENLQQNSALIWISVTGKSSIDFRRALHANILKHFVFAFPMENVFVRNIEFPAIFQPTREFVHTREAVSNQRLTQTGPSSQMVVGNLSL